MQRLYMHAVSPQVVHCTCMHAVSPQVVLVYMYAVSPQVVLVHVYIMSPIGLVHLVHTSCLSCSQIRLVLCMYTCMSNYDWYSVS